MADPIQLTKDQCQCLAGIPLCGDLLEQEQLAGRPRVIFSGLVPAKTGTHAWVFDDGLVMVSAEVFAMLGGDPNG